MKLIVESGATKSDWRLVSDDGQLLQRQLLAGMNVSTASMERNLGILSEGIAAFSGAEPDGFYLYTAGIVTPEVLSSLEACIRSGMKVGEIEICNDLLAAARAVCGHSSGIAAIMGTGTNTCFFDGETVSQKVRSGGFILGDEGGGAALGKFFLSDLIKGLVPDALAEEFGRSFDASYEGIVANVYRSEAPSKYLGSLAPFILSHYEDDAYVRSLVDGNFLSFIRRALKRYDTERYPVGIVGGFGFACRDIISHLCAAEGVRLGRFLPEPIEGLISYHTDK